MTRVHRLPGSQSGREGLFYGEARRKFLLGLSLTDFDPGSDIRSTGFGGSICGFD